MEDGTILPVLVKDRTGYKNLCELLTQAHLRSEKGECAVQWNELPEFAEGLLLFWGAHAPRVLFGASPNVWKISGESPKRHARRVRSPESADRAQFLIDVFGRENVYVEIQRHFLRGEDRINQQLCDLAEHYRLPVIATNGVQYAQSERPPGARCLHLHPRAHPSRCRGQTAQPETRNDI